MQSSLFLNDGTIWTDRESWIGRTFDVIYEVGTLQCTEKVIFAHFKTLILSCILPTCLLDEVLVFSWGLNVADVLVLQVLDLTHEIYSLFIRHRLGYKITLCQNHLKHTFWKERGKNVYLLIATLCFCFNISLNTWS